MNCNIEVPFLISVLGGGNADRAFAEKLVAEASRRKIKIRIRTGNQLALCFAQCGHLLHCRPEAAELSKEVRQAADRIYPARADIDGVWWNLATADALVILPGGLADFREILPYLPEARNGNGPVPAALVGLVGEECEHFQTLGREHPKRVRVLGFNTGAVYDTLGFLQVPAPTDS